jgi:hypothetical protein
MALASESNEVYNEELSLTMNGYIYVQQDENFDRICIKFLAEKKSLADSNL